MESEKRGRAVGWVRKRERAEPKKTVASPQRLGARIRVLTAKRKKPTGPLSDRRKTSEKGVLRQSRGEREGGVGCLGGGGDSKGFRVRRALRGQKGGGGGQWRKRGI